MTKGKLILLPNLLGDLESHEDYLPKSVDAAVASLDGLIAENEREGRRFLGRFKTKKPARQIPIALLKKGSLPEDHAFLLEPVAEGEVWGLISDAGLPIVADPGALLVLAAKKRNIPVEVYSGPSSIILALLHSGLPGQRFSFQGYLPKEEKSFCEICRTLEKRSFQEKETEIFIETPYRNQKTLKYLLKTLSENTWLAIAIDLTLSTEESYVYQVKSWRKKALPEIEGRNAVFLFYAPSLLF